jgi:conjugal transfer ATP-binding protein TraC
MAYNLSEFTTLCNGVYGKWFNGRSTFDIKNDEFVVLELEHLLPRKDLFRVVVLQVLNAVSQDLFLSKRDKRRLGFFDEAAQYLKKEGAGGGFSPLIRMVDASYRRARKYGGSFWVILQSVLDLRMLGDLGQVIDSNAAYKFYLKSVDFEKARDEKLITCDQFELELMKSLTTVPGKYSELFLSSPIGSGVERLVFDPFNYLVNTSSPDEVAAIEALVDRGLSYEEAIDETINHHARK